MEILDEIRGKKVLRFCYNGSRDVEWVDSDKLADAIQAEIDEYYIPRPLFNDGKPVQFGDLFGADHICMGNETPVESIEALSNGNYRVSGSNCNCAFIKNGKGLQYPKKDVLDNDSQERINTDISLSPLKYCEKYGFDVSTINDLEKCKMNHLLMRQRKLCEVEK